MSVHTLSAPFLLWGHVVFCFFFLPCEHLSFFFSDVWILEVSSLCFWCSYVCMCWCECECFHECLFCVFVLYLELVVHSTLSPVRMDGDIPVEMRGGEGSSKGASRWPGKGKKMCIRSHCASNVITGSDSSMWHTALPICQSEIGRVTNGYHCYFPQPPPPPPPVLMSVSFSSAGGEEWPKPGW